MYNINHITLGGNLCDDVDVRTSKNGNDYGFITIANNRGEEVNFVRCFICGKTLDFVKEYLSKGDPVTVEGQLEIQIDSEGTRWTSILVSSLYSHRTKSSGDTDVKSKPKNNYKGGKYHA